MVDQQDSRYQSYSLLPKTNRTTNNKAQNRSDDMLFITPVQQSSLTKQEEGGNLILQNKLGGNKIAKNSVTTANRKM